MSWTARESARNWNSVASSADGSKLVAVINGAELYTSIDSGVSWSLRVSTGTWSSVASSADGTKLVAGNNNRQPFTGNPSQVYDRQLYTSTDSGISWMPRESARNWSSVASSADGSKLVAGVNGGQLYISTDSGLSWTPRESIRNWYSVASSADGTKLVAGDSNGRLYTSRSDRTTPGAAGFISGEQYDALELVYAGNGLFVPLSHHSYSGLFTVN